MLQREGITSTAGENVKQCNMLENSLAVSFKELNLQLPCKPETAPLSIYWKEKKTYVHTKTCMWMFIAALFILAPNWKQPQSPSVDERVNKLIHSYHGICLSYKKKWTNSTCSNPEEPPDNYVEWKRQSCKVTYCILAFI